MTIAPYNRNALNFFVQYQSLTFDQVHSDWLPQLDQKAGLALDVGAGSGRDSSGSILKGLSRLRSGPYEGCFRYKSPQFRDNKSTMIPTKDIDKAVEIVREMWNDHTLPAGFPPKTDSDLEVSDSANESDGSLMTDGSIAYLSE